MPPGKAMSIGNGEINLSFLQNEEKMAKIPNALSKEVLVVPINYNDSMYTTSTGCFFNWYPP